MSLVVCRDCKSLVQINEAVNMVSYWLCLDCVRKTIKKRKEEK